MRFQKMFKLFLLLVLVLGVSQPVFAGSGESGAAVLGADSPNAIAGRYIVVFKDSASSRAVENAKAAALSAAGAKLHYTYEAALKGFAADLPEAALNGLRRNPNVAYIEVDQVVTIDATQSPATWGIDRIDQRNLPLSNSYTYNYTGAGVTAYIIDTGLRYDHVEFSGRAVFGFDAFGGTGADCAGHGTHVGGTVGGETYGVAKDVALVAVRVLDCSGSGTTTGVIAGVDWVTAHHAANSVANMSLGGGASTALDTAVRNSIASGVTYSLSAGNSRRDACKYSPARVTEAITVGATTSTDYKASYSNYGTCLDLFAPGSSITSSYYTSPTATAVMSGTSMAAPHVTGVAALYLQAHPGSTPLQVRNAMVENATPGLVINEGRGSPDLLLYSLLP